MEIILYIISCLLCTNTISTDVLEWTDGVHCVNHTDSVTTLTLLRSVPYNEYIQKLCDEGVIDYSLHNLIRINQKNDTVVIMITGSTVSIFSSDDGITLIYDGHNFIPAHFLGKFKKKLRLPDYEKELLLDWNIDSIQILCLYDDNVYECPFSDYVYQFIIKNGKIVSTRETVLHAKPAVPNESIPLSKELIRRANINRSLLSENPKEYNRLFRKKKNINILAHFDNIFKRITDGIMNRIELHSNDSE